jgi:hypothetical protein
MKIKLTRCMISGWLRLETKLELHRLEDGRAQTYSGFRDKMGMAMK